MKHLGKLKKIYIQYELILQLNHILLITQFKMEKEVQHIYIYPLRGK
jgi:hypothetical protein